jgi:hypothetical protein
MPTLDWIGKNAVRGHHRTVPYHLLKCDRELSVGDLALDQKIAAAGVLDSFAGSDTTAHAVLAQNKADGGKRRFVLIEMDPGICKDGLCSAFAQTAANALRTF